MKYLNKSFTVNSNKKTNKSPIAHCGKEAKICINYGIKCNQCVKMQGAYLEYTPKQHT